ncbi:MFS transporter [Curtobacterium sp. S6]|uniref:MFS transporter n=1 Tax=Curtobacterium sp. S6 TaxID=1479623 RepID=UPI0009E9ABC7|nr:MFS transporter [Curtobacterium sp. S6]
MIGNKLSKYPITIALTLSLFAEGSVYYLMIFSISQQGGTWMLTATSLATLLPSILVAPAVGWAVDKIPTKTLWVLSLFVSAMTMICMILTSNVSLNVALLSLQTVCSIMVGSVVFKALPNLHGFTEQTASAYVVGINSLLAIVTPPLSALLFSLGFSGAIWVATALTLISLAIIAIHIPRARPDTTRDHTDFKHLRRGLKSLSGISSLKLYLPAMFAVVLFTTMEDLSGVVYLQDIGRARLGDIPLDMDPGLVGYSIILAAWSTGSLLASVRASKAKRRFDPVTLLILGGALICVAIIVEGIVEYLSVILIFFVMGGIGNAMHNIGVRNTVYEAVPEEIRGRAWSLIGSSFAAFSIMGKFLGTPHLVGEPKGVITFSGLAGMTVIVASFLWIRRRGWTPHLWDRPQPPHSS